MQLACTLTPYLGPLKKFAQNYNFDEKVKESNKKKNEDEDESEWSDDDKYDPKETREERRERRTKERRQLGKKRAATGLQGDIDDV